MPRVQYLKQEVGILAEDIPLLIQRSPAVLTFSIENQIQPRVEFLRDLGISKDNVVKMITRHPQMLHYSFENLEEKLRFLGEIGMNDSETALTVTRLSQFFSLSVEDSLRPKFKYLTNELGGSKDTCVKYPAYFSLSLDQRIRPRHTFLEQFDLAPDPFPMKLLSVKDEDFVVRASKSDRRVRGVQRRNGSDFRRADRPGENFTRSVELCRAATHAARAQAHRVHSDYARRNCSQARIQRARRQGAPESSTTEGSISAPLALRHLGHD